MLWHPTGPPSSAALAEYLVTVTQAGLYAGSTLKMTSSGLQDLAAKEYSGEDVILGVERQQLT